MRIQSFVRIFLGSSLLLVGALTAQEPELVEIDQLLEKLVESPTQPTFPQVAAARIKEAAKESMARMKSDASRYRWSLGLSITAGAALLGLVGYGIYRAYWATEQGLDGIPDGTAGPAAQAIDRELRLDLLEHRRKMGSFKGRFWFEFNKGLAIAAAVALVGFVTGVFDRVTGYKFSLKSIIKTLFPTFDDYFTQVATDLVARGDVLRGLLGRFFKAAANVDNDARFKIFQVETQFLASDVAVAMQGFVRGFEVFAGFLVAAPLYQGCQNEPVVRHLLARLDNCITQINIFSMRAQALTEAVCAEEVKIIFESTLQSSRQVMEAMRALVDATRDGMHAA